MKYRHEYRDPVAAGRFADLVVLKADVFSTKAVPDDQLRNMTSVLTVVGGEIVHDTGALDDRRRRHDSDD